MVGGRSRRYQTPKSLVASTNEPAHAFVLFKSKALASTRTNPEVSPGTQNPQIRGIPIYKIQSKNGYTLRSFGAHAFLPRNKPGNILGHM